MKEEKRQIHNYQKVFTIISASYLVAQLVLCIACYMINYDDNVFEVMIRMLAYAVMQLFTPYIMMLVACALPKLVWNLVWEILGLLVNLVWIPVFYFLLSMSAFLSGPIGWLYVLTFLCLFSFPIVILVKMIMDIVMCVKRRKGIINR